MWKQLPRVGPQFALVPNQSYSTYIYMDAWSLWTSGIVLPLAQLVLSQVF